VRPGPRYPSLYQINTRVWLTELSKGLGRPATLDDIPGADLDRLAQQGFDWIWFLSVWQTGLAGQRISRSNVEWQHEFEETLPDLREQDIAGSGFAITGYIVHDHLGGDAALGRLRERLRVRGLRAPRGCSGLRESPAPIDGTRKTRMAAEQRRGHVLRDRIGQCGKLADARDERSCRRWPAAEIIRRTVREQRAFGMRGHTRRRERRETRAAHRIHFTHSSRCTGQVMQ